jgi:IS5 family transposase
VTSKRRSWRKLHIGIDADSDEIVAFDLTDKEVDDASHVEPLLEQLDDAPESFMGDGAYDRSHVLAKNPTVRFIVPPCKGAMLGSTAAPWQVMAQLRTSSPAISASRRTRSGCTFATSVKPQRSKANQAMTNNLFRIVSRGTGAARSLGHPLLAELPRSLAGVVIS